MKRAWRGAGAPPLNSDEPPPPPPTPEELELEREDGVLRGAGGGVYEGRDRVSALRAPGSGIRGPGCGFLEGRLGSAGPFSFAACRSSRRGGKSALLGRHGAAPGTAHFLSRAMPRRRRRISEHEVRRAGDQKLVCVVTCRMSSGWTRPGTGEPFAREAPPDGTPLQPTFPVRSKRRR